MSREARAPAAPPLHGSACPGPQHQSQRALGFSWDTSGRFVDVATTTFERIPAVTVHPVQSNGRLNVPMYLVVNGVACAVTPIGPE